jgi:hypothetical protein
VAKEGLAFVRIAGAICTHVDTTLDKRAQRIYLILVRCNFRARRMFEKQFQMDYYSASQIVSGYPKFHRSRLRGFTIMSVAEYRAFLKSLP